MAPITITVNPRQAALLRTGLRGLIGVKLDSLAHAGASEVARHRAELVQFEHVIEQLGAQQRTGVSEPVTLAAEPVVLFEIVRDAAVLSAEEVLDGLLNVGARGEELRGVGSAVSLTRDLVELLTRIRRRLA